MHRRRCIFFLLFLWIASLQGALAQSDTSGGQDAYAIYSQLISNNASDDSTYLIAGSTVSNRNGFNIADRTVPGPFDLESPLAPPSCAGTFPADRPGSREVQNDFNLRKDTALILKRNFELGKPYQLLDDRQVADFMVTMFGRGFRSSGQLVPNSGTSYLGAKKLFRLSDVYFDANKRMALVYLSVEAPAVSTTVEWKLFSKEADGHWVELRTWPDCALSGSPGTPLDSPRAQPGKLFVSSNGQGPLYFEGSLRFFQVLQSGSIVENRELNPEGFPTAFLLPAGDYELRSSVRPCDGNCGNLDPPTDECRASLKINAGQTVHAVREETSSGACRLTFS